MNLFQTYNIAGIFDIVVFHLRTGLSAVLLAQAIGFPIAYILSHQNKYSYLEKTAIRILYAFPVLGLFAVAIGVAEIKISAVWFLLGVYTIIPVVCYTARGIRSIDKTALDACRGLGMSGWRIFFLIQLPQSVADIFEGMRLASLAAITIVALGALGGLGGVGKLIFGGIADGKPGVVLAGGLALCVIALAVDQIFKLLAWLIAGAQPQKTTDISVAGY